MGNESPATSAEEDPFTRAAAGWGFPRFARDFPRHPELDALVIAFTRGDYATVRSGAPKLAREAEDDAVKQAALKLRTAITPDPAAKVLFLLAAGLLAGLTLWWVLHDGPPPIPEHAPQPAPTIEHVK